MPDPEHGRSSSSRDTQGVTEAHAVLRRRSCRSSRASPGERTCARDRARGLERAGGSRCRSRSSCGSPRSSSAASSSRGRLPGGTRARRARFADAERRAGVRTPAARTTATRASCAATSTTRASRRRRRPGGGAGQARSDGGARRAAHRSLARRGRLRARVWRRWPRRSPPEADTFVLFGTSHAPMREPFALCRKAFDTPLGAARTPTSTAIDALAATRRASTPTPTSSTTSASTRSSSRWSSSSISSASGRRESCPCWRDSASTRRAATTRRDDARVEQLLRRRARARRVAAGARRHRRRRGPRARRARASATTALRRSSGPTLEGTDRASLDARHRGDAPGLLGACREGPRRRAASAGSRPSIRCSARCRGRAGERLHYEQTVDGETARS